MKIKPENLKDNASSGQKRPTKTHILFIAAAVSVTVSILKFDVDSWSGRSEVPSRPFSPIVLDLDGDGFTTTKIEEGTYFDFGSNGFMERSSWIDGKDGFLARDLDKNHKIDHADELFDSHQSLIALDSNKDGVINKEDDEWGNLLIWNGRTIPGRIFPKQFESLEKSGIAAIEIKSVRSLNSDIGNKNFIHETGLFVKKDGSKGQTGSISFEIDTTDAYAKEILFVPQNISDLPDVKAQGSMYSLHQAMVRDDVLTEMVKNFAEGNLKGLNAKTNAIMFRWAGAQDIEPTSRGNYIDARKLAVVEKHYGKPFVGVDGPNPNEAAGPILDSAYQKLASNAKAFMLLQGPLAIYADSIEFKFSEADHQFKPDFSRTIVLFDRAFHDSPEESALQLAHLVESMIRTRAASREDFNAVKLHFAENESISEVIENAFRGQMPSSRKEK